MQRLGALLMEQGCLKPEQLDFGLNIQKNNGKSRLGQVLKHYHFVTELDIARALARQVGWEAHTGEYVVDHDMMLHLGQAFLVDKIIFPLQTSDGPVFVLSRTDDTQATDWIRHKIKGPVRFRVGVETPLRMALQNLHACMQPPVEYQTNEDMLHYVNRLLDQACLMSATDIHIEPSEKAVEIRLRVDGILRFMDSLHLERLSNLVNVVFHKADVAISDFYHFHDARFSHQESGHCIDVRVSHLPCVHGPALVLRLLDKSKTAMDLLDLGYSPRHWQLIEEGLVKPFGITLLAGPTGCGKTTTLYAMLNFLKDFSRKIITIEDPVEMALPLTTQVQVQEQRGVAFSDSVRAFLRHDPDIILVGEVRDPATAQETMRAALTGHKVFATLHTTRAYEAVLRLHDLGLDTHFIANCLTMVVAQRLVRKLCAHCKKEQIIQRAGLKNYLQKYLDQEMQHIYSPVGCSHCQAGYSGRTVMAEILSFDEKIQELIAHKQWSAFRNYLRTGTRYIAFEDDAKRLLVSGETSLEEIVRVLG